MALVGMLHGAVVMLPCLCYQVVNLGHGRHLPPDRQRGLTTLLSRSVSTAAVPCFFSIARSLSPFVNRLQRAVGAPHRPHLCRVVRLGLVALPREERSVALRGCATRSSLPFAPAHWPGADELQGHRHDPPDAKKVAVIGAGLPRTGDLKVTFFFF